MCIQIFGVVICIDNVILVSCVTALFALISYVKRKLYHRKLLKLAKEKDKWMDLDEMLDNITDENIHAGVDWGKPVGKEHGSDNELP